MIAMLKMPRLRLSQRVVGLVILGAAVTVLGYALRAVVPPFAIGFFYVSVALLTASRGPYSIIGAILYNAAFAVLALGLFEGYLALRQSQPAVVKQTFAPASPPAEQREGSYVADFLADDPDLGYHIAPGARTITSILKRADGTPIYDVSYTIDAFGFRTTPGTGKSVVYFFGDSFTFGEGVDDDQTLPAWFSRVSGDRALNFGVPGYGPHQALRALELDQPALIHAPAPMAIVYSLLTGHVGRAAGYSPWDRHGPSYELVNGVAVYAGPFPAKPEIGAAPTLIQRIFAKWLTYQSVRRHFEERTIAANAVADRDRVLAILVAASQLTRRRYGVKLIILLWDTIPSNFPSDADWLTARLTERGIPVVRLSQAEPRLQDPGLYLPIDGHPSGAAYRLAAQALAPFVAQLAR